MIARATSPADLLAVADLFREYAAGLHIDLAFQQFEAELVNLPGRYSAPTGVLLLAREVQGAPSGCVALKALPQPGYCEMKRLYVRPSQRESGLGRSLVQRAIDFACDAGYTHMRLDTLASMEHAHTLYRSLGFGLIPAYHDSPIPNVLYFEKVLPHPAGKELA